MKILKHVNQVANENTYFLINDKAILVIDPGSDSQTLVGLLKTFNLPIAAILLTHTHYDHIISIDVIRQNFNNPPVYVSPLEANWLGSPSDNGSARHPELGDIIISPADYTFENDKTYTIAGFQFKVVPTPGHSHGSVSFIFPKNYVVFVGDAIFKNSLGRTDLPTGDFDTLIQSVKTQILTLPNYFDIYTGHGDSTTVSHEKTFNPFLQTI